MKMLTRPGLILLGGLVLISGSLIIIHWQMMQRETTSLVNDVEQRIRGVSHRAATWEDRYWQMHENATMLAQELATVQAHYESEKRRNTPLREELRDQIAARIKLQAEQQAGSNRIKALREEVAEIKKQLSLSNEQLALARQTLDGLTHEHHAVREQLEHTSSRLQAAVSQRDELQVRLEAGQEENKALRNRLMALASEPEHQPEPEMPLLQEHAEESAHPEHDGMP